MDRELKEFGKDLDFKDMPIDVLICSPLAASPFADSMYLFSGYNQKLLAINIEIEKFEMVRNRLITKFGSCISEGYCEIGNSVLLLDEKNQWALQVYFHHNLELHLKDVQMKKAINEKSIEKKLNEAF